MAERDRSLTPRRLVADELAEVVRDLIDEAEDYTSAELWPTFGDAWRRFYAMPPSNTAGHAAGADAEPAEGGSDLVMSEIRDAALGLMPDLMEMFAGSDLVVEYYDDGTQRVPEFADLSVGVEPPEGSPVTPELASRYANAVFWEQGGYRALHDATLEGVVGGLGWWKVHRRERRCAEHGELVVPHGLPLSQLVNDKGLTIDEAEPLGDDGLGNPEAWRVKGRRYYVTSRLLIEAVAASDMIVTQGPDADDPRLIGEWREATMGDLVAMGIEPGELEGVRGVERGGGEAAREARTQETRRDRDAHGHWSLERVTLYEVYPLVDADGDGLPERYRVLMAGQSRELLRIERVDDHPYVPVSPFLIPHRLHGMGYGTMLWDLQEARTVTARNILDNGSDINDPVWVVPKNGTDRNALASWRTDKIVTETIPGSVREIRPQPIINQLLPVHEWLDTLKEGRTGQSRVSQGLDPDALQNTTATAAAGTMGAAQRKTEMVARNVAELGLKLVFVKLLRLMRGQPPRDVDMPGGGRQRVDPQHFDPAWGCRAVVGLGNMRRQELRAVHAQIFGIQAQVVQAMGPDNPLAPVGKIAQGLKNWLALYPSMRPGDYFGSPDEVEQYAAQKAQQGPPPDPKMVEAQAKADQGQQRLQLEQQKAGVQAQLAGQKAQLEAQVAQQRAQGEAGVRQLEAAHKAHIEAAKAQHEVMLREMELQFETALKKYEIDHRPKAEARPNTNVRRPA